MHGSDEHSYKLSKRVYGAEAAKNALDRNFVEFLPPPRTVDEFFQLYGEYFYILPRPTHEELFTRSKNYAWPDWENPRLQQIRNLQAEIERTQEEIDSIERRHPFIRNSSCLYPIDIYTGTNATENAIANNHIYYLQSNKLRRLVSRNFNAYQYIKNQQTFRLDPKPTDEQFLLGVDVAFIESFQKGPTIATENDLRSVTTLEINRYNGGTVEVTFDTDIEEGPGTAGQTETSTGTSTGMLTGTSSY